MQALIDFDLVVYKSAASAEEETLDIAIYRMENLLDYILTATKADSYVAYLGSDTSFRKKIYAEYKANRTTPKPKWLQACKEHAIEHMDVKIAPASWEGDDCVAVYQSLYNSLNLQFENKEPYKSIFTSKGVEIWVSLQDYNRWKDQLFTITASGYAYRGVKEPDKYVRPYLHCELLGVSDDQQVDHINGNKLDNRRTNLRVTNNQQNSWNCIKKSNNTSSYKGVSWKERDGCFIAQIMKDGKGLWLGSYLSAEDAARAYDKKAIEIFGEYAKLNFKPNETIICSLDKDLLQVPGKHYQWAIQGGPEGKRWSKPDAFYDITELDGWRRFYLQCLTGDPSDNIKGVKGVGKVGAEALMSICFTEKQMFDAVRDAYGNDDEFIMNASCLYVLRSLDDSFIKVFERNINASDSE